jgi:hypothetical protein
MAVSGCIADFDPDAWGLSQTFLKPAIQNIYWLKIKPARLSLAPTDFNSSCKQNLKIKFQKPRH